MDKVINADTFELSAISKKILNETEAMKSEITDLTQICDELNANWSGKAKEKFISLLKQDISDLSTLLSEYEKSSFVIEESIKKYSLVNEDAMRILELIG